MAKSENTTVMCLSIGTSESNNFSIFLNVKFIIFRCPKIWAHYSLIIMCSNIGTPKIINFPFGTNGKLMVLGVPIFKHFSVLLVFMSEIKINHMLKKSNFLFLLCFKIAMIVSAITTET